MNEKAVASTKVDAFVAQLEPPMQEVVIALRRLVLEVAPGAEEGLKWGMPCYEQKGLLCSISSAKGYVRLQFFHGADLPDQEGLLEGTGKGMRHIKVRSTGSIQREAVEALVREAVQLNASG